VARVLIVEDEVSIADTLRFALTDDGHEVAWVRLGQEALDSLKNDAIHLVILDVGLPDRNGFEVCKQIRKTSEVPIIFLSARGTDVDRIVGLEIGGDDYVVKPFSPREVAARVRTVLRRADGRSRTDVQADAEPEPEARPPIEVRDGSAPTSSSELHIDVKALKVSYSGQALKLTPIEFKLAQFFAEHPGQVFSRAQLLEALGLFLDANYERNIDGHIKTLRAKLREVAPGAEPIVTHRGFGYSYEPLGSERRT
jgi:two-component system, OmpR family, catabolic regulation response regulator CreB